MKGRTEDILAIVAVLLVLFTAMLDLRVSIGIAATLLAAFAVCRLAWRRQ
jgi:hypothetical protein